MQESPLEANPFASTIPDPVCNLNLRDTLEFMKAFSMKNSESRSLFEASAQRKREGIHSAGQRRSMEASSASYKPVFSFSAGNLSRKSIPSKWDDAEKWLVNGSCHESPAHVTQSSDTEKNSRPGGVLHQKGDAFAEKLRVAEEKVRSFQGHLVSLDSYTAFHGLPSEVVQQGSFCESVKAATAIVSQAQNRDIGTKTSHLGSMATLRCLCHAPLKSSSPARHNTPADMSGPLVASNTAFDISELKDCHFAKLKLSVQYDSTVSDWSSREEKEEEVSKSSRHSDTSDRRKSFAETRASLWEDEQRTKICVRYQREKAKIQAWVNLQSAKAEAQSRKLEVKIQKMRSSLEEMLMKRMTIVQRRAGEWRAAAQLQHSQQILIATEQSQKMKSQKTSKVYCGCFPCNHRL